MPADRDADTSMTLLERLQTDPADPQAWDLFVARYQPRIKAWCLTWGLQPSDADDVSQEVLVKLVAAMRKFRYDPTRSFRGWLNTITKNAWCDFLAARKKDPGQPASPLDTFVDSGTAESDFERQIEEAFDAEVADVAMRRVKVRVKPSTWAAFQLTAIEGISGADAAQQLQIPVAHVFVAKNRVQKMLQEEARILRNGQK